MDRQQAPAGLTEPLAMRRCKGAPPEARIWTMRQSSRASSRSSVPPLVSRERDRDLRASSSWEDVDAYKIHIDRSLLLGLEVLVAADIVKTIALEESRPTDSCWFGRF